MLLITYTLLGLYSLPLFIILVTFSVSNGFATSSIWSEFSIALSGIYLSPTRDSLGTFVVPFVTAYAITTIQKRARIERQTIILFFVLVTIFIASVLVYCAINMRIEKLIVNLDETNQSIIIKSKEKLLLMSESYVKETLAYISLLLGISQSSKAGNP